MKFLFSFFSLILLTAVLANPTYAQTSNIVISEFAAVTEGSSDWVEIHNTGSKTVSLEGWEIGDETDSNRIPLDGCIKPGSYRKFAFSNRLNNDGDKIRIFNSNDVEVDLVEYFSSEVPSHSKGGSTEKNLETGVWQTNTNPTPTNDSCSESGNTAIPGSFSSLSLSEVYPSPEKGSQEWVEIYNPNKSPVTLAGWYLVDAANHKKTLSGTINGNKYKAFYFSSGWLNNSGDTLSLFNPFEKLIEKYSFGKADSEQSFAKDSSGQWQQTSTPTPNGQNKITGQTTSSPSTAAGSNENLTSSNIEAAGLEPTVDFVSDALQFDTPEPSEPTEKAGEVAGVNSTNSTNSLVTLLISAGFAFLATALVWPFLEKYKIV